MTKFFSTLLLLLPLWAGATDLEIRAAEIVGYGIFDATNVRHSRGFTPNAIAKDAVRGIRFIDYTTDIAAVKGRNFGFQYVINSTPAGKPIDVTSVVKFPAGGLKRPNGKVYHESKDRHQVKLGRKALHGYGFDEDWEIVPGEWIFEVRHRGALIIKKSFNVYLPEGEEGQAIASD